VADEGRAPADGVAVKASCRNTTDVTVTDGAITGNTLAGAPGRGPFTGPLWSGAGMADVTRSGDVYESGGSA
jgi:hypothetical protein